MKKFVVLFCLLLLLSLVLWQYQTFNSHNDVGKELENKPKQSEISEVGELISRKQIPTNVNDSAVYRVDTVINSHGGAGIKPISNTDTSEAKGSAAIMAAAQNLEKTEQLQSQKQTVYISSESDLNELTGGENPPVIVTEPPVYTENPDNKVEENQISKEKQRDEGGMITFRGIIGTFGGVNLPVNDYLSEVYYPKYIGGEFELGRHNIYDGLFSISGRIIFGLRGGGGYLSNWLTLGNLNSRSIVNLIGVDVGVKIDNYIVRHGGTKHYFAEHEYKIRNWSFGGFSHRIAFGNRNVRFDILNHLGFGFASEVDAKKEFRMSWYSGIGLALFNRWQ